MTVLNTILTIVFIILSIVITVIILMQEGIMHFTKWQACGNDFVFVNAMTMDIRPVVKKCVSICNRNFGIGADGIIFVLPSS